MLAAESHAAVARRLNNLHCDPMRLRRHDRVSRGFN